MSKKITDIEEIILDPNSSSVKVTKKLASIFETLRQEKQEVFAQMPVDYEDHMFLPRRDSVKHSAFLLRGFNGTQGDYPVHSPFHTDSEPHQLHQITFYPDLRMRLDITTLPSLGVRVGVEMSRQPMIDAGRLLFQLSMRNLEEK